MTNIGIANADVKAVGGRRMAVAAAAGTVAAVGVLVVAGTAVEAAAAEEAVEVAAEVVGGAKPHPLPDEKQT